MTYLNCNAETGERAHLSGRINGVLGPYREIFAYPGTLRFSLTGLLGRFPISMVTIAIILLTSHVYGEYTVAGISSAVYTISQSLCAPQLAKLVDRHGQAKVMRPSLAIAMSGLVGLGVAAGLAAHPFWVYLAAAVAGAFMGSMAAMTRSRWSFVITNPKHIHTAYSWESVVDEFVFVVGPVLATFLATQLSPLIGLGVAILLAGGGGFAFLAQRNTEPPAFGSDGEPTRGTVLTSQGMLTVVAVFLCLGTIFGASDVSSIGYAESLGKEHMAGFVLASLATGSLISGFIYGARTFTMELWKQFIIGITTVAVGASLFMIITGLPILALAMFLTGFAVAPTIISGNNLIKQFAPPHRLTEGLAWTSTAIGLGFALGSAVAGRVIDVLGPRSGFYAVFTAAAAAALTALIAAPRLRRRHQETVPDSVEGTD